jgi:hypothetical protein
MRNTPLKIVIILIVFFTIISGVNAALIPGNLYAYYTLNTSGDAIDSTGLKPLIQNGTVPLQLGKINNSRGVFSPTKNK